MTSPDREPRDLLPDVVPVAPRGRGPLFVAVLVVAAFAVGLVRPWDWPAAAASGERPGGAGSASGTFPGEVVPATTSADGSGGGPHLGEGDPAGAPPAPYRSPTCASPLEWRAATIESWTGRQARVWTAAEAVAASGPNDPAIPFRPIVSEKVTAIGWCAPVEGSDRPPLTATATLFRIGDRAAAEIPYDRLEPVAPDALGELIVPPAQSVGGRPAWVPGRYVIRISAPGGTYVRYLGLDVMTAIPAGGQSPASPGR
jgi:hypothetical protein